MYKEPFSFKIFSYIECVCVFGVGGWIISEGVQINEIRKK